MMLGTINHIAIAVPDLAQASEQWGARTGAIVSPPQTLPEHGVLWFLSMCRAIVSNC